MIKQKRSKVKQAILPFILERTYETITPRAGLVLFGEFLYGLRLNQRTDKYLPLPKSGRGYKPKDFILPLVLNACLPTGRREDEWRPYENGSYIAETGHCMEKTNQAFRLIVVRKPYQPRLFGEEEIDLKERYKVIATNFDWPKDAVVKWKSLLFSFNFHSFSCQKYPFPKINRGFWGKILLDFGRRV